MKCAAVVRHVAFEDLGTLQSALTTGGYSTRYHEAGIDDLSAIDSLDADLLIVLGGPIGVYDHGDYPFLDDELRLLKRRLASDRPTLGICLGAQLIAAALGARVYPGGAGKEIGWSPVIAGPDAPACAFATPLFDEAVEVLHWHGDTFDMPAGARHLACSDRYPNQAFAWGSRTLALQFHPEVTAAGLERWYIGHAAELSALPELSVPELRAASRVKAPVLATAAARFWTDWLATIERPA